MLVLTIESENNINFIKSNETTTTMQCDKTQLICNIRLQAVYRCDSDGKDSIEITTLKMVMEALT